MKQSKRMQYFKKVLSAFLVFLLLLQLLPNTTLITNAENKLQLSSVSSITKNGYKITMIIRNTTNKAAKNWSLKLNKSEFNITKIKNAIATKSGNYIIITPLIATNKIRAKGEIRIMLTCKGKLVKNYTYKLNANAESKPDAIPKTTSTSTVTPIPSTAVSPTPEPEITVGTTKIPSISSLQPILKLPDPFLFKTGSKKGTRVSNKSDWSERRAEISALAQAYEFGIKPSKPQSVTGAYSNNVITVTCTDNGKTISFQCKVQYPNTGKEPYPAMIGVNWCTLNTEEILKLGVAVITFPADDIGKQENAGSRGKGKFFDLYGSNYDAGALMTWAWGVDCMIDALEMTPDAKIDPTKLGVTGGSRNGKGALAIGAFDERIALTVPQEAGNGGSSGWRTADAQMAAGQKVQTLDEIIDENCWFSKSFHQFKNKTALLPFDHHEIFALCAPRGLLVIENPDFLWLGPLSGYETSAAGQMVYEALGVKDNMGYSSIGSHGHCQFPASQQPELTTYIQKFLLGQDANTSIFKSDKNFTLDQTKWIDWTIPNLR